MTDRRDSEDHDVTVPLDAEQGDRDDGDLELVLSEVTEPMARRFIEQGEIAAGGMGVVWLVEDRALRRSVASKTLVTELRDSERAKKKFIREARITGQLEHPNIVPVHHLGVDADDNLFFTMKLVGGKTLSSLIQELPQGPIEHHQLLNLIEIVIKVCHALAFAHSKGVVHCDVKSANVMVGEFGEVYLMDWGVAYTTPVSQRCPGGVRAVLPQEINRSSEIIGTPSFVSPEQARGEPELIDQRSDVFMAGAILYEILTRRPPYRGPSVYAVLIKAAETRFPPPEEVVGEAAVPPALGGIVMKAMAADKEDRYQSIEELQEALVMFSRGATQFPRTRVTAGTTIIQEGEEGDAAYFIVEGKCLVTVGDGAERRELRTMGPGDAFGETAILSPGPRTATVTAIEDTTLEVVTRLQFEHEMAAVKPWLAAFIRTLADRFREREGS
jgi:serine/threonine-protein kinase